MINILQKFKLHIIAECLALHGMITKKKDFHKACYNSNDTKTLNKNVLKVDFEPCGAVYHKIHNKPKKKKERNIYHVWYEAKGCHG